MILSLEQRREKGWCVQRTIEVLDMLRPHLARAVMLTIEVQKRQTELTLHGLSVMAFPRRSLMTMPSLLRQQPIYRFESQGFFQAFDRAPS